MAAASLRYVLVTGANKGIGWHLAQQIAVEFPDTYVYVGSRNKDRGDAAVAKMIEEHPAVEGRVESIQIDITDPATVEAAKAIVMEKGELYALINNAGVAMTASMEDMLNVNTFGTVNTTETFMDALQVGGRVCFTSSAAGPSFLNKCDDALQKKYTQVDEFTWEDVLAVCNGAIGAFQEGGDDQLKAFLTSQGINSDSIYGMSKWAVNCYTQLLARDNTKELAVNACTPGWIATDLARAFTGPNKTPEETGAKPPSEGTVALKYIAFGELEGNGRYYGSDAVRSPLYCYRGFGQLPYTGGYDWKPE